MSAIGDTTTQSDESGYISITDGPKDFWISRVESLERALQANQLAKDQVYKKVQHFYWQIKFFIQKNFDIFHNFI